MQVWTATGPGPPTGPGAPSSACRRPLLLAFLLLQVQGVPQLHTPGQVEFNCFSLVDETQWALVLGLNTTTSLLSLLLEGAGQPVMTCLTRQQGSDMFYRVKVVGDHSSQAYLTPALHSWEGGPGALLTSPPSFPYLIYKGRYRLQITFCTSPACSQPESVFSEFLSLQETVNPCCTQAGSKENCSSSVQNKPQAKDMKAVFMFSFSPCSPVQEYDTANLTLYSSPSRDQCGSGTQILSQQVGLQVIPGEDLVNVTYTSPKVRGDRYYCLTLSLSHISCLLPDPPSDCDLRSDPVWVPYKPVASALAPLCTTHLSCLWLYITLAGSLALTVSLALSLLLVRCCSRHRPDGQPGSKADEVDGHPCQISMSLSQLHLERKSWGELHGDWDGGKGQTRGKILLLYSPDTSLFRELCQATKSFLDLACHCDVYDLFDDALFDTIALDPSEWLQEFVYDKDVKIVVISSIGAHRRQMALRGEMPLNLPDNNLLDGLFTSGLRFISSYPGLAGSGRVATARFEMLQLTDEEHKLGPPLAGGAVREFLVPTQLHELFCWLHHLKPLDIMGQPWANYQLEMQLLQDALKLVRRDRTVKPNFTNLGNGITRL